MKKISVILVLVLGLASACIGNRQTVKMSALTHAVSMTPQIYGSDGKIKADGVGLEVLGDIEISHRYWSLVYSFVPVGDTNAQVREFDALIAARGGQGVINFQVENGGCDINNAAFLIAPAVLPFFPGCSNVTFRGKLVREVK